MRRNAIAGLTLIEVLVTVLLITIFTTVAVTQIPKANQPIDRETLALRVGNALEAAHVQAIAERTAVHITAADNHLSVSTPAGGTETDTFAQATLSGTLDITPDGTTTGNLVVSADHFPCTLVTLDTGGTQRSGTCEAGLPATDPGVSTPPPGSSTGTTTSPTPSPSTPPDSSTPPAPAGPGGDTGGTFQPRPTPGKITFPPGPGNGMNPSPPPTYGF